MKRRTMLKLLAGGVFFTLYGCQSTEHAKESEATASVPLELYCFQAGKADAFLLTTEKSAVLIDTGEKGFGKEIVAYLQERNITALDYLIVTHFDKDHVGGAAKVLRSVTVKQVLQSNCPKDSEAYENYQEALTEASIQPMTVRSVTEFTLDGVRYSIDPPTQETYVDDTSNNSSLIVTVQNGENRLLFMGDAEKDRMAEFIPRMEGSYDLVKLPHHGQWENNLSELLQAAAPRYAVITSSEEIPEDTRTTDWLAEQGIEALLTRIAPISIVSDGQTLTAGYV